MTNRNKIIKKLLNSLTETLTKAHFIVIID